MMKVVVLFLLLILIAVLNCFGEDQCKRLVSRPPRGVACFHCLNEKAPNGPEPFVSLLKESCLENIGISFLLDDSFGFDSDEILNAIDALSSGAQKLWLHLYVYNGPAQRRWDSGAFSGFAIMHPGVFRAKIKSDADLQKAFTEHVQRSIPVLELAKARGVKVTMAPGLEDNLDDEAFDVTLGLIRGSLPADLIPELVRSSCSDCAIGNETSVPDGTLTEKHTGDPDFSTKQGIVCNDGTHFSFTKERERKWRGYRNINTLGPAIKLAGRNRNLFLLWSPKYQDTTGDSTPIPVFQRKFKKPNKSERKEIIKLLKGKVS